MRTSYWWRRVVDVQIEAGLLDLEGPGEVHVRDVNHYEFDLPSPRCSLLVPTERRCPVWGPLAAALALLRGDGGEREGVARGRVRGLPLRTAPGRADLILIRAGPSAAGC